LSAAYLFHVLLIIGSVCAEIPIFIFLMMPKNTLNFGSSLPPFLFVIISQTHVGNDTYNNSDAPLQFDIPLLKLVSPSATTTALSFDSASI